MQRSTIAAGLILVMLGGPASEASPMQSAVSDCRDEAVSTGLEQEEAIQAYVELCLQRFAGLADYEAIASGDYPDPPVEEALVENEAPD